MEEMLAMEDSCTITLAPQKTTVEQMCTLKRNQEEA